MRRLRRFIQSKCILSDGPLRAALALRLPDLFYEPVYQRKFPPRRSHRKPADGGTSGSGAVRPRAQNEWGDAVVGALTACLEDSRGES